MKIRSVVHNNRKKAFEVRTSTNHFVLPFSEADPAPTSQNPVVDVFVDPEVGREAFTYVLRSGKTGLSGVSLRLVCEMEMRGGSGGSGARDAAIGSGTIEKEACNSLRSSDSRSRAGSDAGVVALNPDEFRSGRPSPVPGDEEGLPDTIRASSNSGSSSRLGIGGWAGRLDGGDFRSPKGREEDFGSYLSAIRIAFRHQGRVKRTPPSLHATPCDSPHLLGCTDTENSQSGRQHQFGSMDESQTCRRQCRIGHLNKA